MFQTAEASFEVTQDNSYWYHSKGCSSL